jgi:hypothetical protein
MTPVGDGYPSTKLCLTAAVEDLLRADSSFPMFSKRSEPPDCPLVLRLTVVPNRKAVDELVELLIGQL